MPYVDPDGRGLQIAGTEYQIYYHATDTQGEEVATGTWFLSSAYNSPGTSGWVSEEGADALAYTAADALQAWLLDNLPPGATSANVLFIYKRTTAETGSNLPYPAP